MRRILLIILLLTSSNLFAENPALQPTTLRRGQVQDLGYVDSPFEKKLRSYFGPRFGLPRFFCLIGEYTYEDNAREMPNFIYSWDIGGTLFSGLGIIGASTGVDKRLWESKTYLGLKFQMNGMVLAIGAGDVGGVFSAWIPSFPITINFRSSYEKDTIRCFSMGAMYLIHDGPGLWIPTISFSWRSPFID